MLVERPFMGENICAEQGSYLQQQKLLELQSAMEKLKQFPKDNFQRYHEVHEDKVHRRLPAARFNCHMDSISTEPISYINSRVFEGAAYRRSKEFKRPVNSHFPKMKREVAAFGPKHAEHARRVYESKGTQHVQKSMHIMVPPYGPNYDPMQVLRHRKSQVIKGSYLLGEHVHDRSVNQTTFTDLLKVQVPNPGTPKPYETVLKVAKISPRPNKKHPTKTTDSKVLHHKVEQGLAKKSDVFQDSGCGIDLSNSPIFQILCEISNNL